MRKKSVKEMKEAIAKLEYEKARVERTIKNEKDRDRKEVMKSYVERIEGDIEVLSWVVGDERGQNYQEYLNGLRD